MQSLLFKNDQFRERLFILKVILIILFTILHHFVIMIPSASQWVFFGILVLITGIPHGALDHQVAKQSSKLNNRSFSQTGFYFRYLVPMVAYGIFWFLFPTISLYIFFLLSAFHFGETDLTINADQSSWPTILLQTSYGLLVLFVILFFNIQEVIPILDQIDIFTPSLIVFLKSDTASLYSLTAAFILFVFALGWYSFSQKLTAVFLLRLFILLLVVVFSSLSLSLPLSFAIYFGLWHSVISLQNIRQHLSSSEEKNVTWLNVFIKCIPFTLFSFAGIFALIFLFNLNKNMHLFLIGLFIGISILTLPHQEVMSKMYFHIRKKPAE